MCVDKCIVRSDKSQLYARNGHVLFFARCKQNISYKKLELMSCAVPSKSIMLENYQDFPL